MKYSLLSAVLLIVFIAIATSCNNSPRELTEDEKYIEAIKASRQEKDSMFKFNEHSPIAESEREGFSGLNYFAPSKEYKLNAEFYEHQEKDTVKILTTKPEDIRMMLRYGEFRFKLGGKELKLQAYTNMPVESHVPLFIPFADLTNGSESYEVGRYLEQTVEEGVRNYILDFNLAYSPYCAYNERYSCPMVPEENVLNVRITAGEKNYKLH